MTRSILGYFWHVFVFVWVLEGLGPISPYPSFLWGGGGGGFCVFESTKTANFLQVQRHSASFSAKIPASRCVCVFLFLLLFFLLLFLFLFFFFSFLPFSTFCLCFPDEAQFQKTLLFASLFFPIFVSFFLVIFYLFLYFKEVSRNISLLKPKLCSFCGVVVVVLICLLLVLFYC